MIVDIAIAAAAAAIVVLFRPDWRPELTMNALGFFFLAFLMAIGQWAAGLPGIFVALVIGAASIFIVRTVYIIRWRHPATPAGIICGFIVMCAEAAVLYVRNDAQEKPPSPLKPVAGTASDSCLAAATQFLTEAIHFLELVGFWLIGAGLILALVHRWMAAPKNPETTLPVARTPASFLRRRS
jgi:hypothetical protein